MSRASIGCYVLLHFLLSLTIFTCYGSPRIWFTLLIDANCHRNCDTAINFNEDGDE